LSRFQTGKVTCRLFLKALEEAMSMADEGREVRRVRALFLRMLHLGMRPTRNRPAVRFPAVARGRDHLSGRRHSRWLAAGEELVLAGGVPSARRAVLEKALNGTRIVVLPGNHDEFLREYLGTYFGEIEMVDRTVHTTAQGKT